MTLMVIGDFTTSEMITIVKKKYGSFPAGALPDQIPVKLHLPDSMQIIRANGTENFPEDLQYLNIGYLLPPPLAKDFASLQMLAEFLGGKKDSVLDQILEHNPNKKLINFINAD
jgi:predicted Zn-dependent peptidase